MPLPDEEPSPFDMPVEEVGEPIDLSDPVGRLNVRLGLLVRREGRLADLGLVCPIKDRSDTVCSACPISEAADSESRMGHLCRIGREQERVVTGIAVEQTKMSACPPEIPAP